MIKLKAHLLATILLSLLQYDLKGQECACPDLLNSVVKHVENNYPGFKDDVTAARSMDYETLRRSARAKAVECRSDTTCYDLVKGYTAWFKDHHLQLHFPKSPDPDDIAIQSVEVRHVSEEDVRARPHRSDPIEGIWDNGSYRLAIVPSGDGPGRFDAVVLRATNESWSAGDVKAKVHKAGDNVYDVDWVFGDRMSGHRFPAHINGDILDITENFLARVWPEPTGPVDLDGYANMHDPSAPKLDLSTSDLAVFTFPNFYPDNHALIKELLATNADQLAKTRNWIIDLRGNEGGDVRCGRLLLPYLQTNTIKRYNARVLVTKDNVEQWWNEYILDTYSSLDSSERSPYDEYKAELLAHEGELYSTRPDAFQMVPVDSVLPNPQRVVILMDGDCVSSGELFIMEAEQSTKVTVMGTNSGGMIDYGDVLHYPLPCASTTLQVPSTRFTWLDEGLRVDDGGLEPDIRLTANEDALGAAKRFLGLLPTQDPVRR